MPKIEALRDRSVIEAKGKDIFEFLQGIVTNDVNLLKENEVIYSLILTPQGKFLYEVFLYSKGSSIIIDCNLSCAEELITYLNKFKLRADVTFDRRDDLKVIVSDIRSKLLLKDPRCSEIGYRNILSDSEFKNVLGESKESVFYNEKLLALGVPNCHYDLKQTRSFPMNFCFDKLNAISFTKGCYVGQELTARMKHRDMVRKKIMRVQSDEDLSDINYEKDIILHEKKVGSFLNGIRKNGICLVNVEETLSDQKVIISGINAVLSHPVWLADN
ncbi:MAG: hypothetical protein RLN62_06030 [Rickettsiales bacterium]